MPVLGSVLLSTSVEVAGCSPPSSVYFFPHWSGEDPVMKPHLDGGKGTKVLQFDYA